MSKLKEEIKNAHEEIEHLKGKSQYLEEELVKYMGNSTPDDGGKNMDTFRSSSKSHGRSDTSNIMGFSSREVERLFLECKRLEKVCRDLENENDRLRDLLEAHKENKSEINAGNIQRSKKSKDKLAQEAFERLMKNFRNDKKIKTLTKEVEELQILNEKLNLELE